MSETDIVGRITLRLVSDIEEQLTRDSAALTTFEARLAALKASNLGAITAPSVGGSNGSVAALTAIENGANKANVSLNGLASSVRLASAGTDTALEAELAAVIKTADAHSLAADREIAASQRVILSTQTRSVTVARAFALERDAATLTAVNLNTVYAKAVEKGAQEVLNFGAVTDATKVQIKEASVAVIRFAEAMKIAGDSAGAASAKSAFLGREFLRVGDTANIAGAKVRVFDSMALGLTGNLTLLGVAIVGLSGKAFADFQQKMQQVGANTGLTRTQIASLTQTILSMGAATPVTVGDLAEGFRHIISEGYNLAESAQIAKAALASASAEGANFGDVASALATQMHNFGDGANKAAQDMGALMIGAQEGNLTLQDLSVNMNKLGVEMSAIHQPLGDAVALLAELTRATGDPAIANTWAAGLVAHVIKPTKEAITVMGELKQSTGIDLLAAFKAFSAGTLSFGEMMKLAKDATHGNAQEIMTLFGGLRGGLGALQLINGGLTQYNDIQGKTAKGAHELSQQAAAAQDNLEYKFNVGVNLSKIGLIEFGAVLNSTIDKLGKLKDGFNDLPGPIKGLIVASTGVFAPVIGGIALTKKGIDLLIGSTDHHTESIKKQLDSLEKQKQAILSGKSADEGYRLGAENSATADERLAEIIKKEAELHRLAADRAEQHRTALNKVANEMRDHLIPMESQYNRALAGAKQPVYSPPTDSDIAGKIAQANADVQIAANRLANDEITKHTKLLAGDRAELARALGTQELWNNAIASGTAEVNKHDAALQKLEAELKRTLTAEIALTNQGLVKEKAAFVSMADSAIEQAKRMRAGVEVEAKAMQVAITKSVAWTPILQPPVTQITPSSALNNHQASFGPVGTQFPTSGPSYNPNGAQTMDPALATAMSGLTSAIHALPPQFQGAFDGELAKYKQQQTDIYNQYLSSLNKENRSYADGIKGINSDYHAKLAANLKEANAKEVTENTQYLDKLDSLERAHNDRLQAINAVFLTSYQRLVIDYQAALAQAQMKAEADALAHEDAERQLAANEQAQLAGIHGKNAAARRQAVMEQYARDVGRDGTNYQRTVTANENHVKGLSSAFDHHVAGIVATANRQIAQANTNLATGEKGAAQVHAAALAGIKSWLTGHDTAAEGKREAALAKLAGLHIKHVNGITEVFDKHGKLLEKWGKAQSTPEALLKTIGANNDTEYNKALAKATLDILEHGKATRADIDALQEAQAGRTELQNAENAATLLATANLNDLAASISALNTVVDQKENAAAGLLYAGMQDRRIGPGTTAQQQHASILRGEGLPDDRPSDYSTDINAAIAAQNTSNDQQKSRTIVNAQVMSGSGDVAGAYAALLPLYQQGKIQLTDFIGTAKAAADETVKETQRTIDLDVALGDFIGAAGLAKTAYENGKMSLVDYVAIQKLANAETASHVQADIAADIALGDFAGAADLAKKAYLDGNESLTDYVAIQKQANAEAASRNQREIAADIALGDFAGAATLATKAYEDGTGSFEDAVSATKLANAAAKARTDKDWDVAFAAADLVTRSQMLSAAFSGLISQASTKAGAQSAVDNANIAVIAAQSAVEVQLLQSEITATQDLGGIITAQASVQKAIFDGQLAAINDQVPIMQSSYAVQVAEHEVSQALLSGNSFIIATANAGLKVAQDQLAIDRFTAEMNQTNAKWQIRLAEDAARLAMDKLLTDNANSSATARVLMDHLQVAHDAVDIALAQQKLTLDTMVILANIDSTLGGVTDYGSLIGGDLTGLQNAQAKSTADQYQEAYDQANANQIAAQGGLTLAGDQNALTSDQSSAASVSQRLDLQLAEMKKQLASDNISQQALQAISKTASELLAATTAGNELLKRIEKLNNEGLQGIQRIDVTGSSSASIVNGLGTQMAANPTH